MDSVTDSINNPISGPLEPIPDNTCYCQYVTFLPCHYCQTSIRRSVVWVQLSTDEKSKAIAYKRIIKNNKEPSRLMLDFMALLHKKYEDFDIGVVP